MFAKLMEHTSTVLAEADRSMLPQIVVVVNKQSTTIAITITITLTTNTTTATTNLDSIVKMQRQQVQQQLWI
ncbi:hypothetical protein TYRP_001063 [Tyrophagus putrescentiae]|nr:hypothetical protein TYRP_001063 [Tyrophagus putrescentiae]